MKVLVAQSWSGGYLDETLLPDHVRIRPEVWVTLFPVDGQYFVRPGLPRTLLAYARAFGVRAVVRKMISRLRERERNQRFVGVGFGTVIGTPAGAGAATPVTGPDPAVGTQIVFVAPCHPACMERVVLHRALVRPAPAGESGPVRRIVRPGLVHRPRPATAPPTVAEPLIGWTPMSGSPLPPGGVEPLLAWLADEWTGPRVDDRLLSGTSPVTEVTRRRTAAPGRPTAALFGYGHYAKTQIVPHVREQLDLTTVHEIDPLQIGSRHSRRCGWDTSPIPRDGERPDVLLIAGYHHTHGPLALAALRAGSVAVVEKPVVTTEGDLDQLVKLIDAGGRLFACFQRRHSEMNDWLRADLRLDGRGEPLMYSAVVYEEPLPARHWYRWPSSRTRLVSNGCHWIDHFLWLNDFAAVRRSSVARSRSDTFTVYVELVNDAVLSLVLTSAGGSRYGLREHSQLRANGTTVTIIDGARYSAEASSRLLRGRRVNRLDSYPAMYRDICADIVAGRPGLAAREISTVAELTLRLDAAAIAG